MKKLILAGMAVLALGAGTAAWYFLRFGTVGSTADGGELRATMRDENAPRKMEPSLVIQVNDAGQAEVPAGTPLWVSVNVTNTAAANEVAAGRAGLDGTRPGALTLGDARKPWSDAVEIRLEHAGGVQAAGFRWNRLGDPGSILKIDAASGGTATFGMAALETTPGEYAVSACLGPAGEWKGIVCSQRVSLKVGERAEPARQQAGRFAFLAGDAAGLESHGRRLLSADRNSLSGLLYVAEASYQRGEWDEARRRFTAAQAAYARQKGKAAETPLFALHRLNQIRSKH